MTHTSCIFSHSQLIIPGYRYTGEVCVCMCVLYRPGGMFVWFSVCVCACVCFFLQAWTYFCVVQFMCVYVCMTLFNSFILVSCFDCCWSWSCTYVSYFCWLLWVNFLCFYSLFLPLWLFFNCSAWLSALHNLPLSYYDLFSYFCSSFSQFEYMLFVFQF